MKILFSLVIGLLLSMSLTLALPQDSGNSINFNYPTNTSTLNVNNSNFLEGHPASYFYPYSNPFSFFNITTLPNSNISIGQRVGNNGVNSSVLFVDGMGNLGQSQYFRYQNAQLNLTQVDGIAPLLVNGDSILNGSVYVNSLLLESTQARMNVSASNVAHQIDFNLSGGYAGGTAIVFNSSEATLGVDYRSQFQFLPYLATQTLRGSNPNIQFYAQKATGGIAAELMGINIKDLNSGTDTKVGSIGYYGDASGPSSNNANYIYMGTKGNETYKINTMRVGDWGVAINPLQTGSTSPTHSLQINEVNFTVDSNSNLETIGNITASNLCYSNGSNCNISSSNLDNYWAANNLSENRNYFTNGSITIGGFTGVSNASTTGAFYGGGATASVYPQFNFFRFRGTYDTPTKVSPSDVLGSLSFYGNVGGGYAAGGRVISYAQRADNYINGVLSFDVAENSSLFNPYVTMNGLDKTVTISRNLIMINNYTNFTGDLYDHTKAFYFNTSNSVLSSSRNRFGDGIGLGTTQNWSNAAYAIEARDYYGGSGFYQMLLQGTSSQASGGFVLMNDKGIYGDFKLFSDTFSISTRTTNSGQFYGNSYAISNYNGNNIHFGFGNFQSALSIMGANTAPLYRYGFGVSNPAYTIAFLSGATRTITGDDANTINTAGSDVIYRAGGSTLGEITTAIVNTGGINYAVNDTLTVAQAIDGLTRATINITGVNGTGAVTSFDILTRGSKYLASTTYYASGGSGSGFSLNVTAVQRATDKNGGTTFVDGGISSGTGYSNTVLRVYPNGTSGATANTPLPLITLYGNNKSIVLDNLTILPSTTQTTILESGTTFFKINGTRGSMSIGPGGNALPTTTALVNMYKQENVVEGANVLAATMDNVGQTSNLTNLYTFYFSSTSRPPLANKISSFYGIFGQTADQQGSYGVSDNLYGGYFAAQKRGNLSSSVIGGARSYPQIYGNSGLVSSVYAYNTLGYMENSSATATNWYEYFAGTFPVAGLLTNHYGLYLTAPTISANGVLNNSYGIYVNKVTGNLSQHAIYINGVGDGAELNWNDNRTMLDNGTALVINPQGSNSGILYINGSTNIGGNLTVNGILTDNGNTNITGNLNVLGNFSAKRPYLVAHDETTQSFASTASTQVITINTTEDNWLMAIQGNQNLTFQLTGDYLCILSPEFYQNSGNNKLVAFWYQKFNGTAWNDEPWSNSRYTMQNNEYTAPAIPFQFDIENTTSEKVRFMWYSDSTATQLVSITGLTAPTRPSVPSIILNCQKASEITP